MIPAVTRQWIADFGLYYPHGIEHLRRRLILRWMLWQDGEPQNAIPGYDTPPPDCGLGYPAGWSRSSFVRLAHQIEKEAMYQGLARSTTVTP